MKNLKVSTKLLVSFIIVIAVTLTLGIVSVITMNRLNNTYTEAIDTHAKPLGDAVAIMENLQAMRAAARGVILFSGTADSDEKIQEEEKAIDEYAKKFEEALAAYDKTIIRDDVRQLFDDAKSLYDDTFKPTLEDVIRLANSGTSQKELIDNYLPVLKSSSDAISADLGEVVNIKRDMLNQAELNGVAQNRAILIEIIAVLAAAVLISVFLAVYLTGLITKPLAILTTFMEKAGNTGDIKLRPEDVQTISA
ncbi:MAG: MCP four helix bundle domain-containing protein, partial [Oscillospiraceae bacterium]|nr:MCP four helix bundle domain-containing protein [Oscillospiraceae bacterium]